MIYKKGVDILNELVRKFEIPKAKPLTIQTKLFEEDEVGFKFERSGDKNTFIGVALKDLPRTDKGFFDGCVVYICDVTGTRGDEFMPKWHVDYCHVLRRMEKLERLFRYTAHVGSNPDFQFFPKFDEGAYFYAQPRICSACARLLDHASSHEIDKYSFSVGSYIDEFGSGNQLSKRRSLDGTIAVNTKHFLKSDDPKRLEDRAARNLLERSPNLRNWQPDDDDDHREQFGSLSDFASFIRSADGQLYD